MDLAVCGLDLVWALSGLEAGLAVPYNLGAHDHGGTTMTPLHPESETAEIRMLRCMQDLNVRLRASTLRVSENARAYNTSDNEVRVFIDYPFSVF